MVGAPGAPGAPLAAVVISRVLPRAGGTEAQTLVGLGLRRRGIGGSPAGHGELWSDACHNEPTQSARGGKGGGMESCQM